MLELQTANKNKRTKNGGEGITALYCSLSVDDNGTEGESNSIKNQKDILGRYAKQHGYRNIISTTVTAERISIVRIFRE